VIGLLVATAVLFALFFLIETRVAEPILSLHLFRDRVFSVGALLSLAQGMTMFAVIVYLPLFIQGVLGNTATSSGAVITPVSIAMAVVSILVGQLIARIGLYKNIDKDRHNSIK
jgi:predicted MFS family arabinose efflux permease